MRKPGSSSRAKLKSCGRAKTVLVCSPGCFDVLSTTRICQGIHDRACCLNSHTVPSWEAKRRAASQARVKEPCGSKQPKAIQDYSKRPTTLVDPAAPDLLLCLSQIPPIWGANRARSALPLGGDVLLRSSQIPPIWGAKQVRSAFIRPNWRDWANLGDGPAGLIAERLLVHDVADYVGFRAACRRWRHFSLDPHAYGVLDPRFHPRQWIMLKGTGASPHHRRCFLNLSSGDSRFLDLPELRGHDVYGPTTEGLLVLVDTTTFVVRLLNPFTRQAAKLPPATTLLNSQRDINRARVSLSVVGAGLADHGTIAVHFYNIRTLAVVKPGDPHWTVVDRGTQLLPAMSFAGRFYCATTEAVMVVETGTDQVPRLTIAAYLSRPFSRIMRDTVHLVDNDGKLMLVDRECRGNNNRKYKVYGVDLDARKMVPANGFGGRAVFIGRELAHSVSPLVFPSISADAIYLGFQSVMTGRLDHSPIHLMAGTSHPRQFDENMPIYGPLGIDDYLSWCVTGYGDLGG